MRQLKITKKITSRESASLDHYLTEIGRLELITADEEVILTQQIRAGDEKALHKLVNANLRFVVSVSKQYQNQGLSLPDLVNEGNVGLIKAARRFDETRGFKFISYAVWWIRQSIMQAIAEQARIVRLPLNKIGALNKINKAVSKLEQSLEREPSLEEIAEVTELVAKDIPGLYKAAARHMSVDASFGSDGESGTLLDVLHNPDAHAPDKELINEGLRLELKRSLSMLSNNESEVITRFFGLSGGHPQSLEEIAEKFDLTRERVRQIKEKAIRRMRHSSRNKQLKNYL